MVRNRAFCVVAAALAASLVAFIAAAAVGFLFLMASMFVQMPQSIWAGVLFGGLLLAVFGSTFIASFREMLDKLTSS